jgi:hypothetical protein
MERPQRIKNDQLWQRNCRRVVARSEDLIAGRRGVIETARGMYSLAISVGDELNPDFALFRKIDAESLSLPVGAVQTRWAPHALATVLPKIAALEERWRSEAIAAATLLSAKYQWSLKRNLRASAAAKPGSNAI